jgi:hypothetical protein
VQASPRISFEIAQHTATPRRAQPMRQVEARKWWLWGFAVTVTLILTVGIVLLTFGKPCRCQTGVPALPARVQGFAAVLVPKRTPQRKKGDISNEF